MDILLLSISGGLATLSILALVWVIRYSSRKRERLFMLEHIVRRNDWNISKLQCLRSKVLAFISKGNKLIIIDTEGVQQSNVIDLADIRE